MTPSTAKTMVRGLSCLPAGFSAVVLVLSVIFCISGVRELVWWHLVLGIVFAGFAAHLFRRVYLGWRRPSAQSVREVCGWAAFVVLALGSLAVQRLDAQGYKHLSTGVAIVTLPLVVTAYILLRRKLLRAMFGVLLRFRSDRRTLRFTKWRRGGVTWQFGRQWRAAIGELSVGLRDASKRNSSACGKNGVSKWKKTERARIGVPGQLAGACCWD